MSGYAPDQSRTLGAHGAARRGGAATQRAHLSLSISVDGQTLLDGPAERPPCPVPFVVRACGLAA
eukprot:1023533-Alexandrium_andersonii.AAC.1